MRGARALGTAAVAAVALGVLWLSAAPVYASNYDFLARNANVDDPGGEPAWLAGDGRYTWAMKPWVIEGQTTRFCVGFAPGAYRQATFDTIANWEAQFAFPFNEFTDECGSAQRMDVVDNQGWGGYPCDPGNNDPSDAGCVEPFWIYDSGRNGYYLNYVRVWVNTADWTYTYEGMRALIAHEIGHIYGLDEMYLHDPRRCNDGVTSIMDALSAQGNTITGGCDAYTVQSQDFSLAHWFNVMNLSTFQPQNLDSQWYSSSQIRFFWDDYSPTERYYKIYMRYLWVNTEYTCYVLTFSTNIASGDPWVPTVDRNRTLNHVGCPANTFYRGCLELASGVIGQTYWRCSSNWRYLTS